MNKPLIEPWYRQFWPWFLIALPAVAVVASLYTVSLAFKYEASLVADDYYKQGLAINEDLARRREASRQQLSADIRIDQLIGELSVVVYRGVPPQDGRPLDADTSALQLEFIHPFDKAQDERYLLRSTGPGHYVAELDKALLDGPMSRRYLRLGNVVQKGQVAAKGDWVLTGELVLDDKRVLDDHRILQVGLSWNVADASFRELPDE
jgi:hypothetical protein